MLQIDSHYISLWGQLQGKLYQKAYIF